MTLAVMPVTFSAGGHSVTVRPLTVVGISGAVIGGMATGTLPGIVAGWAIGEAADFVWNRVILGAARVADRWRNR